MKYTYELDEINQVVVRSDGSFIPLNESNLDYQAYLASFEEGEPKAE